MTGIRIALEDRDEIDRRAAAAGLSRTQYMIDCALGRLTAADMDAQLSELRERVAKLERRRRPSAK